MTKWHQTLVANIGLRLGGLASLCLAWSIGSALYREIHLHLPREASVGELALCTLLVASVLIGNALIVVGPDLWRQVEVPGRRSVGPPDAATMEMPPHATSSPTVTRLVSTGSTGCGIEPTAQDTGHLRARWG